MAVRTKTSDANTANTLTLPERADKIHWIHFSYSDDPTGGKVTVKSGATTVYEMDVTSGGAGPLAFVPALEGTSLSVVMAAGGSGIVSKVNVRYT